MPTIDLQHLLWTGLGGCLACQTHCDLHRMLAALLVKHLALDQKDLGDVWEIQIPIERLRAPDAPGLNAAMIGRCDLHEIWRFAILKQQRDVVLQRGLITFGCEVVITAALHHVISQLTLCEQGIGRDQFALDLNGIKQWRKHANLIGLLALIAPLYGQSADFFWVWQTAD